MELTLARLKELLHYDPETGEFRWLVDRQRARKGEIAGTICPVHGYRYIGIDYDRHRANRLAWLYVTGEWPQDQIDHIDNDRSNDAWANLRPATTKQNQENRAVSAASLSGVKGVLWQPDRRRWIAQITHKGKSRNLGRFRQMEDAISARRKAEAELFTHGSGNLRRA